MIWVVQKSFGLITRIRIGSHNLHTFNIIHAKITNRNKNQQVVCVSQFVKYICVGRNVLIIRLSTHRHRET